jgi:hypothetical protein
VSIAMECRIRNHDGGPSLFFVLASWPSISTSTRKLREGSNLTLTASQMDGVFGIDTPLGAQIGAWGCGGGHDSTRRAARPDGRPTSHPDVAIRR